MFLNLLLNLSRLYLHPLLDFFFDFLAALPLIGGEHDRAAETSDKILVRLGPVWEVRCLVSLRPTPEFPRTSRMKTHWQMFS